MRRALQGGGLAGHMLGLQIGFSGQALVCPDTASSRLRPGRRYADMGRVQGLVKRIEGAEAPFIRCRCFAIGSNHYGVVHFLL